MSTVALGESAPDFDLPATGGVDVKLSEYRGRKVVLYFYPKDSTPGCTQEGRDFRDLHDEFVEAGAVVFGVSRDSVRSHEKFSAKQGFPFPLLSDEGETVCRLYDVIKEKNMYGRKVLGVQRSTFLIDDDGRLRGEWRGVKVKGHAAEVLGAVRSLD